MPALKNFGITFLISALIFSVVSYFMVGFLTSTVNGILDEENNRLEALFTDSPDVTEDPDEKDPADIPKVNGDSFSVLFALTDKREDVFKYLPEGEDEIKAITTDQEKSFGVLAEDYHTVKVKSIVLVRVSKETGEFSIIPVPAISRIYTQMGAGTTALEDVMYFYDKDYFVQKVSAMTGVVPDYTVIANISEMDDVVKAVGGFTCKVGDDIYSDGTNYFPEPPPETTVIETTVAETEPPEKGEDGKKDETTEEEEVIVIEKVVSRGNVTVGPSNVEALLLYEGYVDDGVDIRYQIHIEFIKGILGNLSGMDNGKLSNVYNNLKDKIEIDMTEDQLLKKGDILRAYKKFDKDVLDYPGKMEGDYFNPDIDVAVRKFLGLRIEPDPIKK